MRHITITTLLLLALLSGGCNTTYVPISWNYGEKVKEFSNSDTVLKILYSKYDPQRNTLRVRAASFAEIMMPYEVKYHLGAYRQDTKLLYRNLYHSYDDRELRDLMVHEFAHHIWFSAMSPDQHDKWKQHLAQNPSPLQAMVRGAYKESEYDAEDFAFVLEYPRPIDIQKLASLNVISEQDRDAILQELPGITITPIGRLTAAGKIVPPGHPDPAATTAVRAAAPAAASADKGAAVTVSAAKGAPVAASADKAAPVTASTDKAAPATPAAAAPVTAPEPAAPQVPGAPVAPVAAAAAKTTPEPKAVPVEAVPATATASAPPVQEAPTQKGAAAKPAPADAAPAAARAEVAADPAIPSPADLPPAASIPSGAAVAPDANPAAAPVEAAPAGGTPPGPATSAQGAPLSQVAASPLPAGQGETAHQ